MKTKQAILKAILKKRPLLLNMTDHGRWLTDKKAKPYTFFFPQYLYKPKPAGLGTVFGRN